MDTNVISPTRRMGAMPGCRRIVAGCRFLTILLWCIGASSVGLAHGLVDDGRASSAARIVVQQGAITHEFMIGEWSTRNIEFGRDVEILWTLWGDGRLAYRFFVDGVVSEGSRGTWNVDGGIVTEHWLRPNGETGVGRGRIEKIDENTLRLSILDNGEPDYQGMVRVYRRRGAPQISSL